MEIKTQYKVYTLQFLVMGWLMDVLPSIVAKRLARHFACGRSRVLTPLQPNKVWVFSYVSPHHHIVVCLISQITVPTTFLPHPSSPPPVGGNEKCILSFFCMDVLPREFKKV
jgi:hypothetical protein